MSSEALLSELSALGVKLKLSEDRQLSVSAPKGSLNEDLLGRLRLHKSALIELLAQSKRDSHVDALPVIVPDPDHLHVPFPSADLQTAFLMGDSEDMEFHVRPHYYLEQDFDELDPVRFEQALNAACYRQRANLVTVTEDMRLQTLRDYTPLKVPLQDLRGLSEAQTEAALQQTRAAMSRQTLPLDCWPWFECSVSLYGGGKARLHYNNNNVFSDGYGMQKLMADAMHYYRHPEQALPEISLSFRDCVLALARLEESEPGLASQRYWLERLPTLPGPPALPLKAGLNPRSRSMLKRREKVLPEPTWTAFKHKARMHGLTPNNALFAVYAELIAYWSGSRHFLLNNMVTHRFPMHPEVNEIVGNFASLYPLEVDWRGAEAFFERARKLQSRIMSDLQHVYWSGVKVLQALNQVQKTPGRAPCPFVIGSGLFMKPYDAPYVACLETPQVLLDHQFWELRDGGLWFVWDLIERFFPDGMIDAMWEAYAGLLTELAECEQSWSKAGFDLLPAAQRRQRAELNQTGMALPQGGLHESLARQARSDPGKRAVQAAGRNLTYGELQRAADRLAQRLQAAHVRPNELIAVMLDKGWQQAVAVYGTLAAGAAYVPIDPAWPQDRIRHLLDSINARLVLTREGLLDAHALTKGVRAILIEDTEPDTAEIMSPATAGPQDLAYIIFTSGSTGMPKGVMIDHRGALNTVVDINRRFGVTERDVVYGISSLYFDLSVYDLFGTVAAGATLVLPDAGSATSPQAWIEAILAQQVTVWNSVPALMQLLVDAAQAGGIVLPSLRTVMLSGDWIPVALPQQIRQVAPNARIISLGGATEASIWSIHFPIERDDPDWISIPYGRPLANQSWHVLDDNGQDAPTWVTGHLHIGGIGLALGYWQDKAKTDAAFVTHPRSGERLYRTGDLGRYLPDGNIEFLGRSDFQVKIQGFRVELGEIEQALAAHPEVRAATVIATGAAAGKQLHAFILPQAGAVNLAPAAVQEFLRGKLPRYMVPNQVTLLEQFPLTANGKVDRQALAKLGALSHTPQQGSSAAATAMEKELLAIWEEVLELHPLGIRDDFFELGGQSFAAVRVMTRIAKQFGCRLPLSELLEGRTVSHLARRLGDALRQSKTWSPLVPIRLDHNGRRPCFFVHPAGGNVLCYRHLAEQAGRPFYGLQAPGLSGEQPPLDRIGQMAARYLQAVRQVQPRGPYLLGGWSSGGVIAFEMACQLEAQGEAVERVLMLDTPAPLQHEAVDDGVMLRWFLEDLDIGLDAASIDWSALPEPDRHLASVLPLLARQRIGAELDPAQLEFVYRVFRATIHACRDYRPASIQAPISVLRAAEGRVSEFIGHPADGAPDWGWSGFTSGTVSSETVPGNHYTILAPQHRAALLDVLNSQWQQTV